MFHVEHFPEMFHKRKSRKDLEEVEGIEEEKLGAKTNGRSALGVHLSLRLFAGLDGIAPRNLFVPARMEGPSPGLGDRPANHAMESSGFPNRAQVDVDDDCPDDYDCGKVVQNVADSDRRSAK